MGIGQDKSTDVQRKHYSASTVHAFLHDDTEWLGYLPRPFAAIQFLLIFTHATVARTGESDDRRTRDGCVRQQLGNELRK